MKKTIDMPVNDSFELGERQALLAVEDGQNYISAYHVALAESLSAKRPNDFLQGFAVTFRSERDKRLVA